MASEQFETLSHHTLAEAFPQVDANCEPLGNRVLVQLARTPEKTTSGIILVEETKETAKWNTQVAKVIALGGIAYKDRATGQPWPEGVWVKPGDYVRVPRWGGDRIEIAVKNSDDPVRFVVFQDHEIISRIPRDPLAVKTYIL